MKCWRVVQIFHHTTLPQLLHNITTASCGQLCASCFQDRMLNHDGKKTEARTRFRLRDMYEGFHPIPVP